MIGVVVAAVPAAVSKDVCADPDLCGMNDKPSPLCSAEIPGGVPWPLLSSSFLFILFVYLSSIAY